MVSEIIQLGYATQDSAAVVARCETAGLLRVVGAGYATPVAVDPAVADGLGVVLVQGLSPGRQYTASVYVDNRLVGVCQPQTMPASGPFGVVITTCHGALRGFVHADWLLRRHLQGSPRIILWVINGDYPYLETNAWESNGKHFGVTLDTVSSIIAAGGSNAQILANARAHHQHVRLLPGHRELHAAVPCVLGDGDDHCRAPGDNGYTLIPDAPSSAEWDEILDASGTPGQGGANKDGANLPRDVAIYREKTGLCAQVQDEWMIGNPPNPAVNGDTRYNKSTWYSHRINDDLEVFVLACISTRALKTAPSPRDMLGPIQYPWLLAGLRDSTARYKAIVSPKPAYRYLDGWASYPEQWADIADYCDRAVTAGNPDGWARPGGVFVACGDMHYAETFYDGKLLSVNVGPATQTFHVLPDGYLSNSRWRMTGYKSNTGIKLTGLRGAVNTCLVADVYGDYIELSLRAPSGDPLLANRIYAGTNMPVEVPTRFAA